MIPEVHHGTNLLWNSTWHSSRPGLRHTYTLLAPSGIGGEPSWGKEEEGAD